METFEDLDRVIGTVSFDSEALIERAVAGGRRREQRRRLAAGVGVLAVGAFVVGASLHSSGSRTADGTPEASQPPPSAGAEHSKGDRTTGPSGNAGRRLPTAQLTDARLAKRLPVPGDLVSASDAHGMVVVNRTVDPDRAGVGSVTLSLLVGPSLSKQEIGDAAQKCAMVAHLNAPSTCVRLADGWMFVDRSRPDIENAAGSALASSAKVIYADGTSVSVYATNYVEQNDPTRDAPVLTMAQVEHLATDPVWFEPAS